MTRRSDMMLEDIFGCDHTPETPISDDGGEILYWICRCGKMHPTPEPPKTTTPEPSPDTAIETLLGRPYKPPALFICEEVELGSGYHTLWVGTGPERDWTEPYKKSSDVQYRKRSVRVDYPPKAAGSTELNALRGALDEIADMVGLDAGTAPARIVAAVRSELVRLTAGLGPRTGTR